ncbi:MAG: L-histidine N(alpha)-methyltransferase [Nitrospinota bacterium]
MARTPRKGHRDKRVVIDVLERPDMEEKRAEIRLGLLRRPREISSKFFYDDRGSALFERICDLPEYYPTRTERALLARFAERIVSVSRADVLVELGSGSSSKTSLLLDAMARARRLSLYVPLDVNESAVQQVAADLTARYGGLRVRGLIGDFMKHLGHIPDGGRRLVIFLGGTIGNLRPHEATALLSQVAARMSAGEFFLLGTDLIKDVDRLEAAYNDAQGVTAEFNKNVLSVLNRLVDADFDPDAFEHRSFYNRERNWIEMRLRSTRDQVVRLPGVGMEIAFDRGEEILTEISAKYDRDRVEDLLKKCGFQMVDWLTDPENPFALTIAKKG